MREALRVIHVLVFGQASKPRLAQQARLRKFKLERQLLPIFVCSTPGNRLYPQRIGKTGYDPEPKSHKVSDGDGDSDIFWHHVGDGRNKLWFMEGLGGGAR